MGLTPDAVTDALYRSMSTELLEQLRFAFEIDRESDADPAFCDGRIALINRILAERVRGDEGG